MAIEKKQNSSAPAKTTEQSSIVHDFKESDAKSMFTPKYLLILFFVALLGVGTGYLLTTS